MDDAIVSVNIRSNQVDQDTQKRFVREAKWIVREDYEQKDQSYDEPSSKKGSRLSPKSQDKVKRLAAQKTTQYKSDKLRHVDIQSMDAFMALLKQARVSEDIVKPKQKLVETQQMSSDLIEIKVTK